MINKYVQTEDFRISTAAKHVQVYNPIDVYINTVMF